MTLEDNLALVAEGYLQQFKAQPILHRIGGKDVAASDGQTFESLSPVDLSVLASIAQGTAADIDAACLAPRGPSRTGPQRPAPSAAPSCTPSPTASLRAKKRSPSSNV